jgi:PPOX class probable F420-dependent enzyme
MSIKEIKKFLTQGTFTAKIATVKKNGSPHVVPVWFVLDDEEHNDRKGKKIGDIILTTYEDSVKARNIDRDNRVSICIDDQTPQYSFVTISGTAKIFRYRQNELLKWATKIARRYMGRSNAKAYGERNSTEGAVLVRIRPTKVIAQKDTAEWE